MSNKLREAAKRLVDSTGNWGPRPSVNGSLLQELETALVDSAAQAVAWRWRVISGEGITEPGKWTASTVHPGEMADQHYEIRPLVDAQPEDAKPEVWRPAWRLWERIQTALLAVVPFLDEADVELQSEIADLNTVLPSLQDPAHPEDAPEGPLCHAGKDGDCTWEHCPQIRDGESARSGRHCPIDLRCDRCEESPLKCRCPKAEDAPEGPKVEHRCGVRGFPESGDDCPGCERDDREVLDRLKGGADG